MPKPDESSQGAIKRLDKRLEAFEASRRAKPAFLGLDASASDGFRLLGQMLGGVLGGLGLGWLVDYLAHTSPLGIVGGLLIGATLGVYAAVRTAMAMSARIPPGPASADQDDGDETD